MATKNITDAQVVKAYMAKGIWPEFGGWPYEILAREAGECEKVCCAAMRRALFRGYIDFGTSLRSGWVTEKGFELLKKDGAIPADAKWPGNCKPFVATQKESI